MNSRSVIAAVRDIAPVCALYGALLFVGFMLGPW